MIVVEKDIVYFTNKERISRQITENSINCARFLFDDYWQIREILQNILFE